MGQKRYRDEGWLRGKYTGENLSMREIGEMCGVSRTPIRDALTDFDIEIDGSRTLSDDGKPHTDEKWLREKYWERGMTVHEMGDEVGCCGQTIVNWMEKHGIDRRTNRENLGSKKVTLSMTHGEFGKIPGGYVQFQSYVVEDGEYNYSVCGSHQLLAISEGADPHKVFTEGENVVHHENGLKWDNRPENIMVMNGRAHSSYHAAKRESAKE